MIDLIAKLIFRLTKNRAESKQKLTDDFTIVLKEEIPRIMVIWKRISQQEAKYITHLTNRIRPFIGRGLLYLIQQRGKQLCQTPQPKNATFATLPLASTKKSVPLARPTSKS
jgi:hypothetical protein